MSRRWAENHLGEAHVPALSDSDLTASFKALDWAYVKANWDIRMFWTPPGSEAPVELPSVTMDEAGESIP